MHELSIAISMVDQVIEESRTRGGVDVAVVHLALGRLSGVDKSALLFCYDAACAGTMLQGSRLVIDDIPVLVSCARCGIESSPESLYELACGCCKLRAKIVRGFELELMTLELRN
jgi:hydrogenase nickel incorporation protein HypA/HybF